MDTLDYSGTGLNQGSKVVIAAAGRVRRTLATELPGGLELPKGFSQPHLALPGVLVVAAPPWNGQAGQPADDLRVFCQNLRDPEGSAELPLIVLADDSEFTARSLNNFLWVTFTRSDPAADIDGCDAFISAKHWGCRGSLVIDARIKHHHAPPLMDDPTVERRVDALGAPGGSLHGLI